MIFLNISTDYVQLLNAEAEELIFRNDVETKLGPLLIQWHRKYQFSTILLLNGPGGFTNLRVGALCLNLLQTLVKIEKEGKFKILELSKLELFEFAVQKSFLPSLGAVYIGQKKTLWLYDFDKKSDDINENYELIKKEELPYSQDNLFFDKVYDTEYFTEDIKDREIGFLWKDKTPVMTYKNQELILDINEMPVKMVDLVKANYMIQPVMG